MSTFNYANTQATATRLLRQFGASAQLQRTVTGPYDPSTGSTTSTTTIQAVTACVFDYAQSYIDGSLIMRGDKQVYVSAAGITDPKQGDVLVWQGSNYRVVSVKSTAPAGTSVLWELQVRNG